MDDRDYIFLLVIPPSLVIILKIVNNLIKRRRRRSWKVPLPPGPWKLPIIGSIHHLVIGSHSQSPHRGLRELSEKYGALMHLQLGEEPTVVISSREAAKEVLKTHDGVFAYRPHLPPADLMIYASTDITMSPIGHHWKLLRKICSLQMLNGQRVRSFQSLREKEVSSLITYLSHKAITSSPLSVNLSHKLYTTIFSITTKAAFGENYKAQEELLLVSEEILKIVEDRSICEMFPSQKWLFVVTGMKGKIENIHNKIDRVLEKIIGAFGDQEEGDEPQCLLSALLNLKQEGHITKDHVKAVLLDIILGGTETSSIIIEWAMRQMMKNPRMLRKAQTEIREVVFNSNKGCDDNTINETSLQELKYLKAVIKETLRLHPSAPLLIPRKCTQTCEINGYTIPIGSRVLVNAWAIGRDPNYWNLAEEFLPESFLESDIDYMGFNFEYIPFGSRKRICPEMLFGVASVEILLANLLCFFYWKLPWDHSRNLRYG
ncbi:premnaspirodiene oxygenase-like [Senna tora]|uniref:Premnaspirodiene oxygenase-like n=1 Tax=Senna tora TaxID=362788 RepID=A0A834T867_9FABA|nr:premnaspirodiene oxygenase-like [Senna tora]